MEDSLVTIMNSISTLAAEWFHLGLALGLSYGTLKEIESNYPRDSRRCQTEMIMAWLQMKDRSRPSWQALVHALRSPSLARIDIATMISVENPSH